MVMEPLMIGHMDYPQVIFIATLIAPLTFKIHLSIIVISYAHIGMVRIALLAMAITILTMMDSASVFKINANTGQ